jgi:hypothetical protein
MKLRNPPNNRSRTRGASILIAALVCLTIVMALLGGMVLSALRAARQLHVERDLRQCELLLAAGAARAISQFDATADYRGEIWRLDANDITTTAPGDVTIALLSDSQANRRQCRIVAEYPSGSETSIRRSQMIQLPAHPSSKTQE